MSIFERVSEPTSLTLGNRKVTNIFPGWDCGSDSKYLELNKVLNVEKLFDQEDMNVMTEFITHHSKLNNFKHEWVGLYEKLVISNITFVERVEKDLIAYLLKFGVINDLSEVILIATRLLLEFLGKDAWTRVNKPILFSFLSLHKSMATVHLFKHIYGALTDRVTSQHSMEAIRKQIQMIWRLGNYYLQCRGRCEDYQPQTDLFIDLLWLSETQDANENFNTLQEYLKRARTLTAEQQQTLNEITSHSGFIRRRMAQIVDILQKNMKFHLDKWRPRIVYCDDWPAQTWKKDKNGILTPRWYPKVKNLGSKTAHYRWKHTQQHHTLNNTTRMEVTTGSFLLNGHLRKRSRLEFLEFLWQTVNLCKRSSLVIL